MWEIEHDLSACTESFMWEIGHGLSACTESFMWEIEHDCPPVRRVLCGR